MHPTCERMAKGTAKQGYTLVELMIVVSIVGVTLAASAPSISRRMAEGQVAKAARELAQLGRRARSETAAYGSAHLVWIDPTEEQAVLLVGATSSCNRDWSALLPGNPLDVCGTTGNACLDVLDLDDVEGEYASGFGTTNMQFQDSDQVSLSNIGTALCYAPTGAVFHGQGAGLGAVTLSDLNTNPAAAGGYRFLLRLLGRSDGSPHGVPRTVVFPLGGVPAVLP